MELRIEPYATPEQISFNYEELKEMLLQKASHYEALVYTDEQIKDAKADRANLNRLKKALNDERIKREKEYMESFNVFKKQINEVISIIDKPCAVIDRQIKEFEEAQKEEKMRLIEDFWNSCELPATIHLGQIMDQKWLNASVSMKSIQAEINARLEQIAKDLVVIENLPAYAFEAKEVYINALDLGKAVSEANRMRETAEKKSAWEAEQERRKAEAEAAAIKPTQPATTPDTPCTPWGAEHQPEEPQREWVKFQAFMTVDEAKALGQYMRDHRIQYKAV